MGGSQYQGQINVLGLVGPKILPDPQALGMANHFIDCSKTKLCHDGSQLIGNVVKEVDNVLRSTLELLAELGILGRDTDWACVL